jgi:putative methionine-R-sulfoxide reductase with GAF domain
MDSPGPAPVQTGFATTPRIERRKRLRHKIHTPAYASFNGIAGGEVIDLSEILDLSEEGVAIQTGRLLGAEQQVEIGLDLSEAGEPLRATGRVAWSMATGRTGIAFRELHPDTRKRLQRWLFLNALVACAHQLPASTEKRHRVQREKAVPAGANQRQPSTPETLTKAAADYTSLLSAAMAVRREVETLGDDLDAGLQLIAERAESLTGADGAAIALVETSELTCCASSGSAPPMGSRLPMGSGFSGECVRTGRLLRCDDAEKDATVDREICAALGIRSMAAVPVRLGDRVIGILELFSAQSRQFDAGTEAVLQRLAETTLAALNRARKSAGVHSSPGRTVSDQPVVRAVEKAATETEFAFEAAPSPWRRMLLVAAAITLLGVSVFLAVSLLRGNGTRPSKPAPAPTSAVPASPPPMVREAEFASPLEDLRRLAASGDPDAQFAFGARYAIGQGVPQDYSQAVRWFLKAAEQGHVVSQATLGAYYWAGRGVPQNLGEAYYWSILAQAGGDEASKYRVAVLTSRMTHAQVLAAQQRANQFLQQHPGFATGSAGRESNRLEAQVPK